MGGTRTAKRCAPLEIGPSDDRPWLCVSPEVSLGPFMPRRRSGLRIRAPVSPMSETIDASSRSPAGAFAAAYNDPLSLAEQRMLLAEDEISAADAFARLVVARAADKYDDPLIGWDPRMRTWWLFQGSVIDPGNAPRWRPDTMNAVDRLVMEFQMQWGADRKAPVKSARMHSALVQLLKAHPSIVLDPEAWDRDPDLLGTPGGVVDLRTGALRPARPADAISKCTAVAPGPEEELPQRWIAFLYEALGGDEEMIEVLRRFFGYSLTGHVREHVCLAILGAGGAGVSTFVNCFERLTGSYTKATASETFTASSGERHPADMAALAGVRAVIAPEVERRRHWSEPRLKGFISGDTISARVMRGDPFEFRPVGKLIVTSNSLPSIGAVDRAMRRRLLLARFDHVPVNPQRDLLERLIADEGPAILRWFVQGAADWYAHGLRIPERMRLDTDEYLDAEDSLTLWLEEFTIRSPQETATTAALFRSWKAFCEGRGEHAGTTKALAHTLRAQGFTPERNVTDPLTGQRVRGYRGLSLR